MSKDLKVVLTTMFVTVIAICGISIVALLVFAGGSAVGYEAPAVQQPASVPTQRVLPTAQQECYLHSACGTAYTEKVMSIITRFEASYGRGSELMSNYQDTPAWTAALMYEMDIQDGLSNEIDNLPTAPVELRESDAIFARIASKNRVVTREIRYGVNNYDVAALERGTIAMQEVTDLLIQFTSSLPQ